MMPTIDKIIIRLLLENYMPSKELYKYGSNKSNARRYVKKIVDIKEIPIKTNEKGYYLDGERARKDAQQYLFFKYENPIERLHYKTFPEWWKRAFYWL